jgi:hypothetical protein
MRASRSVSRQSKRRHQGKRTYCEWTHVGANSSLLLETGIPDFSVEVSRDRWSAVRGKISSSTN